MTDTRNIHVVKNDGQKEIYDPSKLRFALQRAGANDGENERVMEILETKLFDGISTHKIYQIAYAELKRIKSHRTAGRYKLKAAIFNLGPTGYPFEIFIGKLFESLGFETETGLLMEGKCVRHEVDVLATKGDLRVIVECKFHQDKKSKTSVQVPMYIRSRFKDIEEKWRQDHPDSNSRFEGYVVTNTRFTQDAMDFAKCAGLGMISWNYPHDNSLRKNIDMSGLHPITSLHSLRRAEQKKLLEKGIVLSSDLESYRGLLTEMGITERRVNNILREAEELVKE